nr:ABC transporter permease [Lachnospiraceae bacterium]
MKNLLRFEFRKMFRRSSLYICLGAAVATAVLTVFTTYSMYKIFMEDISTMQSFSSSDLAALAGFTQLDGWGQMLIALTSSSPVMLMGIFIALLVCSDYSSKTAKNIIGRGYSRTGWLSAKLAAVGCACLLFSAVTMLAGFLSGTIFWEAGEFRGRYIVLILLQLLIMMGYAAVFVFWSVLLRSSGGAIALNLVFPTTLSLILTVLDLLIFEENGKITRFWLSGAMQTAAGVSADGKDLWLAALAGVLYTVVFTGLSYMIVNKRDV